MKYYEFVETEVFTEDWESLGLDDEDFRGLQKYLIKNPEAGDIMPGTGGLRKLRWAAKNKGKRGGARILYVLFTTKERIYLISAYGKNDQDDITEEDKKIFRALIKQLEREVK